MKTITATALLALCASLTTANTPNPGSEYTNTVFLDEFNGPSGSGPSTANWIYEYGTQYDSPNAPAGWGNFEVQYYTSQRQNLKLTGDGALWMIPRNNSGNWTSSRIETVGANFHAPAGGKMLIQARIKLPSVTGTNGIGYWPAFWATGAQYRGNYTDWPMIGEYDIMENINGETDVTQSLHCDVDPNGVCNEPDGLGVANACGGSCIGDYHVYGLTVDRTTKPEKLQYSVDNVVTMNITQTQLGTQVWDETVHHGYYLILNVAMGGNYPNAVAGVTTPTENTISGIYMAVDYVGVWTT